MSRRTTTVVWAGVLALVLGACGRQAPVEQREAQTIQFASLPDRYLAESPVSLVATASSGLPVGFAGSGACTVAGGAVALTTVGTCTVTASQDGDASFLPATPVARSFEVLADVDRVGFVVVSETGPADARVVNATGTFDLRAEPVNDAWLADAFGGTPDTCTVTPLPGEAPAPEGPGAEATPLDAGSPLTVRAAGAAYADLIATEPGRYALGAATPSVPLPAADLTLDVPGAAFPAFPGAGFADTAPFVLSAPAALDAVTADSAFAWAPGAATGSVALLVGGDANAIFSCVVADDGAFAFDDGTRTALTDAGFGTGALQAAGRLSIEAHTEGDALLLLGTLRLESYGADPSPTSMQALLERALPGVPVEAFRGVGR